MAFEKSKTSADDISHLDLMPVAGSSASKGKAKRTCRGRATLSRTRKAAQSIQDLHGLLNLQPPQLFAPVSGRKTPTRADVAWAAGLFDGEGCVHIACQTYPNRRAVYRLRVSVSQVNAAVLREFGWAVGVPGRLYSPRPTKKQKRICHALVYDGVEAFLVLQILRDHLRRKQAQTDLARRFRDECDIHRHPGPKGLSEAVWALRRWFYDRMKQLNQEG